MKMKYYVDEDDRFNRFIKPWIIATVCAALLITGIILLCNHIRTNSDEYKRREEIETSLSKAPEEGDYRENIPDEEIGNYHYNGEEIINYPGEIYLVKKVINGNTIVVGFQGGDTTIRILGTNIPSCYAKEAKKKTEEVLLGRRIRIDFDSKLKYSDNYVAAYVGIDTFDYGLTLVGNGYAYALDGVDYEAKDSLLSDELYAKIRGLGLWSKCDDSNSANRV